MQNRPIERENNLETANERFQSARLSFIDLGQRANDFDIEEQRLFGELKLLGELEADLLPKIKPYMQTPGITQNQALMIETIQYLQKVKNLSSSIERHLITSNDFEKDTLILLNTLESLIGENLDNMESKTQLQGFLQLVRIRQSIDIQVKKEREQWEILRQRLNSEKDKIIRALQARIPARDGGNFSNKLLRSLSE